MVHNHAVKSKIPLRKRRKIKVYETIRNPCGNVGHWHEKALQFLFEHNNHRFYK